MGWTRPWITHAGCAGLSFGHQVFFKLRKTFGVVDDIDHSRQPARFARWRAASKTSSVSASSALERAIRKSMSVYQEMSTAMPRTILVNAKPVMAAIREFFGSSPASASSWTRPNPLSRNHPQAASLGPWAGRSVARARGFEVRDVHPTHYGRICPDETPEGPTSA